MTSLNTDAAVGSFITDFIRTTGGVSMMPGAPSSFGSDDDKKKWINAGPSVNYYDPNAQVDWNGTSYVGPAVSSGNSIYDLLKHPDPIYRTGLDWQYSDAGNGDVVIDLKGWVPGSPDPAADIVMRKDYAVQSGDMPFAERILATPVGSGFIVKRQIHKDGATTIDTPVAPDNVAPSTTTAAPATATSAAPVDTGPVPFSVSNQSSIDAFLKSYYAAWNACHSESVMQSSSNSTYTPVPVANIKALTAFYATPDMLPFTASIYVPDVAEVKGCDILYQISAKYTDRNDGDIDVTTSGLGTSRTGSSGAPFEETLIISPSDNSFIIKAITHASTTTQSSSVIPSEANPWHQL